MTNEIRASARHRNVSSSDHVSRKLRSFFRVDSTDSTDSTGSTTDLRRVRISGDMVIGSAEDPARPSPHTCCNTCHFRDVFRCCSAVALTMT